MYESSTFWNFGCSWAAVGIVAAQAFKHSLTHSILSITC